MHLPGFRALIWNYPHCPFENIPFAAIKVILMTIIEVIKAIYGARCSVCPAVAHVIIIVYSSVTAHMYPVASPHSLHPSHNLDSLTITE